MQNVEQTIISQYANSPTLLRLIQNFNAYIDPAANIDAFYNLVFNVATAQGYGLDVWGRIVGVGRVLQVATGNYFGFTGPNGVSGDPYDQSPFYSGQSTTSNFALSDNGFRTLIYAKALSNISNGSTASINQIMLNLLPNRGNCYVIDNNNMTIVYQFNFSLTPVEQAILFQSGVLPKPAGVAATFVASNKTKFDSATWDNSTWS